MKKYQQRYSFIFVLCFFSTLLPVMSLADSIHIKVDRVSINTVIPSSQTWTSVSFQTPFDQQPVVIVTPTNSNLQPTTVRVRNITRTGFEMLTTEPQGAGGVTTNMEVDFLAAEPGTYTGSNGTVMIVGRYNTTTQQGRNASGGTGFDTVSFGSSFTSTPAVVTQVQTVNSQSSLDVGQLAEPWLEVTVRSVSNSSAEMALERSETNTGLLLQETIGYVAIESGSRFEFSSGDYIDSILTADNISGWDNGCYTASFTSAFSQIPIVVASQNTRDGSDGGWVRRCNLSNSSVGLAIDEDQSSDSERSHTTERVGVLAMPTSFSAVQDSKRVESGSVLVIGGGATSEFKQVTFDNEFTAAPLIFTLSVDSALPSSVRYRNITNTGFELAAMVPTSTVAPHPSMTVDYMAIAPGSYELSNGDRLEAGSILTDRSVSGITGTLGGDSWEQVSFSPAFSDPPAVQLHVQTINNESSIDPSLPSVPWLVTAGRNLDQAGIEVALERNEVSAGGTLSSSEIIGYVMSDNGADGSFTDINGNNIDYQFFNSQSNILGHDNGCFGTDFLNNVTSPYVVASQVTRNGNNGGWVRRCDLDSSSVGLTIDEDQDNDSERTHINEVASIYVFSSAFEAFFADEVDYFSISHDGSAVNCLPEAITITAYDVNGNVLTSFDGDVSLSTSTDRGLWSSNGTENGTLSASTLNDGLATYTFSPLDAGRVTLLLQNSTAEVVNINVDSDGVNERSDLDPDLTFSPTGIALFDGTLTNPLAQSQLAAKGTKSVPGSNPGLAVVTTDPNTGSCQPLVNGVLPVTFHYHCINPDSASCAQQSLQVEAVNTAFVPEGGSGSVTLDFGAGGGTTAPFDFTYNDAGSIRIDVTANINGTDYTTSSSNFVVRPAGFCIESPDANADCATADASCSVFKNAGEVFNLRVAAVGWESDSDSDLCLNNTVTPSFIGTPSLSPSVVAPVGGVNGILGSGLANITSTGEVTISDQTWSEVGVLNFVSSEYNYLGETIPETNSDNIGRFIPGFLSVTNSSITDACDTGGFSYLGQGFTGSVTLEARSGLPSENITENYRGDFARFTELLGSVTGTAQEQSTANDLSTNFNISRSASTLGIGTVTVDLQLQLDRASETPEGPYDDLRISIEVEDADGVSLDSSAGGMGNLSVEIGSSRQRFGRLWAESVYGPESASLSVPFEAQYWNGQLFVTNDIDSCTAIPRSNITFDGNAITSDADLEVNLDSGATTGSFVMLGTTDVSLLSGDAGLQFDAPGVGNIGSFPINVDFSGLEYLRYNWDGVGAADTQLPTFEVRFGSYRGHDRIIYWQEQF